MFRPGTVNKADYSPQEPSSSDQRTQPFGNIQKISQEGSKNTYVIILSKDCIKGESSKGPPVLKCPPVGNHGRALARRPVNSNMQEDEFDSPTLNNDSNQHKIPHPKEDVKLNLSNINDDEYDSNTSATNVFLKPEFFDIDNTQDSAIEADMPETSHEHCNTSSHSRTYFCEKSKMNTYVIPSPLTVQQEKRKGVGQHTFPMISPQFTCGKQSLLYNTPIHSEKQSMNTAQGRKIYLVTPEQGKAGALKKSVAYTNEAVPTMGKSKVNEFSGGVSLLTKTNPKAVPTFNNISPISQTQLPTTNFVPINPSVSPSEELCGPFTSTPLTGDTNPRLQQLKHESLTHRPVYIIQSPFSQKATSETPGSVSVSQTNDSETSVIAMSSVPKLNNSSGFVSGSGSLELFEASSSGESPRIIKDGNGTYSPMEMNGKYNYILQESKGGMNPDRCGIKCSSDIKPYNLDYGTSGIMVQVREEDNVGGDPGIGIDSETDQSVTSSQEFDVSDIVEISM